MSNRKIHDDSPLSQSVRRAGTIAVMVGTVGSVFILGLMVSTRWKWPEWLMGSGSAIWNVFFGGPYHNSLVWFFSVLAINAAVYSAAVFAVQIAIIAWKRR